MDLFGDEPNKPEMVDGLLTSITRLQPEVIASFVFPEKENFDLRSGALTGCRCSKCGHRVQIARQTLTWSSAEFVLELVRLFNGEFKPFNNQYVIDRIVSRTDARLRGGMAVMGRHWNLIEGCDAKGNPTGFDSDVRKNMYHKLTEAGLKFAKGETFVYKHRYIYLNRPVAQDGPLISIEQAKYRRADHKQILEGEYPDSDDED